MQSQTTSNNSFHDSFRSRTYRYPTNVAQLIKQSVTPERLCQELGLQLTHSGFITCISHRDTRPSMKVYDSLFVCFACGAKYDVIGFVREYFQYSFYEAVDYLNNAFSLGLSQDPSVPSTPVPVPDYDTPKRKLRRAMHILSEYIWYVKTLKQCAEIDPYFLRYRKQFYHHLYICEDTYYRAVRDKSLTDEDFERVEKLAQYLRDRGFHVPEIHEIQLYTAHDAYLWNKLIAEVVQCQQP